MQDDYFIRHIFRVNGTMIGMLGEIYKGVVDTSIAGFAVTEERFEFVSFSPGIFKTATRGFIRRPKDTDLSFIYHIGQFLPSTWISLLTFYTLCLLILFITYWNLPTSLWSASKNSILSTSIKMTSVRIGRWRWRSSGNHTPLCSDPL